MEHKNLHTVFTDNLYFLKKMIRPSSQQNTWQLKSNLDHVLPLAATLARYMLWSCVCLSVCPPVRHKWELLNLSSCKQHRPIADGSTFPKP